MITHSFAADSKKRLIKAAVNTVLDIEWSAIYVCQKLPNDDKNGVQKSAIKTLPCRIFCMSQIRFGTCDNHMWMRNRWTHAQAAKQAAMNRPSCWRTRTLPLQSSGKDSCALVGRWQMLWPIEFWIFDGDRNKNRDTVEAIKNWWGQVQVIYEQGQT